MPAHLERVREALQDRYDLLRMSAQARKQLSKACPEVSGYKQLAGAAPADFKVPQQQSGRPCSARELTRLLLLLPAPLLFLL